ncbi:DUF4145 domain-containing protein [Amycolatopsis sp. cg13]|uniref:DUF4145 domain-containing protein n=1 Tax=Amycolatopsis sp. cg13 TaxID=3238807 RepID=UPI00352323DB
MRSNDTPRLIHGDWFQAPSLLMNSYTCDYCGKLSVAWMEIERELGPKFPTEVVERMNGLDERLSWLPRVGVGKTYDDVPDHIAGAASEAQECLSINAGRAAVSLARAVVEATAKAKGITSGNLVAKIDKLHADGHIRAHVREIAHEIRHLGNDMAHGDFVDPVEKEEAEETLGLMDEVLSEVFQSPARLERRKAARLEKKKNSSPNSADPRQG